MRPRTRAATQAMDNMMTNQATGCGFLRFTTLCLHSFLNASAMVQVDELFGLGDIANNVEPADGFLFGSAQCHPAANEWFCFQRIFRPLVGVGEIVQVFFVFNKDAHKWEIEVNVCWRTIPKPQRGLHKAALRQGSRGPPSFYAVVPMRVGAGKRVFPTGRGGNGLA